MTKTCNRCDIDKPLELFQRDSGILDGFKNTCKECIRLYNIEYRKVHRDRIRKKKQEYYTAKPEVQKSIYLRLKYNLTIEQYTSMLETQNHKCASCGSDSVEHDRYKNLCVDHCHKSGKVRGLLCHPCNTAIGAARENTKRLEACASYLKKHGK